MQGLVMVDGFLRARYGFFRWRYSLALVNKIALAFGMACVTGLLAQVRFYLPFTPVPVTGQVLGVLLSGVICGGVFGSVSQAIYVGLGMAGVPWFAHASAGSWAIFISPTGGYLIGFILAPLLIGKFTDRYIGARTFLQQLKFMMCGVGVIYLFGAVVLAIVLKTGFLETFVKGVIPFIGIDLVKAAAAAGFSSFVLPKTSYNGEADK